MVDHDGVHGNLRGDESHTQLLFDRGEQVGIFGVGFQKLARADFTLIVPAQVEVVSARQATFVDETWLYDVLQSLRDGVHRTVLKVQVSVAASASACNALCAFDSVRGVSWFRGGAHFRSAWSNLQGVALFFVFFTMSSEFEAVSEKPLQHGEALCHGEVAKLGDVLWVEFGLDIEAISGHPSRAARDVIASRGKAEVAPRLR